MKILLSSNYFHEHIGGIEFVSYNLVNSYRQRVHEVHWIAGDVPESRHYPEEGDIPINVYNFTERDLGFPFPIPSINSVKTIFRQVAWSDVIHIHDCLYPHNILIFLFSRVFKKPVLITQHIDIVPYPQKYKVILQRIGYSIFGRMLLGNAEQVVFINKSQLEWFSGFIQFYSQPQVIPNAVDHEIFSPAQPHERRSARSRLGLPVESPILLFIGRFTFKKGMHLIKQLIEVEESWFWVLVGRPGDQDPNQWSFPNLKTFPPHQQDLLRDFYIATDLLVLPSTGEGFPLVIQEALSCGTPVMITKELASAQQIPDSAFLEAALNLKRSRSQISNFLSDPELRKSISTSGEKYIEEYRGWQFTAKKYLDILKSLVRNAPEAKSRSIS